MAQPQKKPKQPQDPYAQRGKTLASSVQRLRGWLGTDPTKLPDLVDALSELTAHRLVGHAYPAAAADAQDAVRRSAELMAAKGPIGPYTELEDVTRCGTALVHLAAVQAGLRVPEAAGQSVASWDQLREQVAAVGLAPQLDRLAVVWALSCSARAALAAGEVGPANAYVDAALARVADAGLREDPDAGYVPMDADWLAADCRWAAGRPEESLGFLAAAKERHDTIVAGRLAEPGRYGPALVERLAEPLSGLHRDLADRLAATGETDLALSTRRGLIDVLRGLVARLGDPARWQLAAAWADLAADLRAAGRSDEAESANVEAVSIRRGLAGQDRATDTRVGVPLGAGPITWLPLSPAAAYATGTEPVAPGPGAPRENAARLTAQRDEAHRLEAERVEQARIEAQRRRTEQAEAARVAAERDAEERAHREDEARREADRQRAAAEQEQQERKRRRAERLREHRRAEIEERRTALLAVQRTDVEALELERLDTELAQLDQTGDEPAEPAVKPEAAVEPEPVPEAQPAPEPEPDELVLAEELWRSARAAGDRKAVRAANERVVELLRLRAQADLPVYGPRLQAALEDLASARLRGGDLFGSRSASREAKAIGKSLGR
ncbi:MAG: hypothetical protein ACR2LI_10680 [Propionibacteriaceae bacterium]